MGTGCANASLGLRPAGGQPLLSRLEDLLGAPLPGLAAVEVERCDELRSGAEASCLAELLAPTSSLWLSARWEANARDAARSLLSSWLASAHVEAGRLRLARRVAAARLAEAAHAADGTERAFGLLPTRGSSSTSRCAATVAPRSASEAAHPTAERGGAASCPAGASPSTTLSSTRCGTRGGSSAPTWWCSCRIQIWRADAVALTMKL